MKMPNGPPENEGIRDDRPAAHDPGIGETPAEGLLRLQSSAVTAAANAIVITDRNGTIVWVNPSFTILTGYTPVEAIGKNPRDLVKSGQQEPKIYQSLWETILAGRVWHGELINRRKDGSLYFEEQTITPVCNAAAEITHFIGIKQDLTARKRAEREVSNSYEMLQRVINNIPQHVFWKDRNLCYLGANTIFARSGGLRSPAEIIGKSDFDLAWKRSAEAYRADDRAVIESGVPKLNFEEEQQRPDGSLRWLRTSKLPLIGNEGEILGLLGIYEDITGLKAGESLLREQNEILSNSHEGVMVVNLANQVSLWNDAAEKILGWTRAEVMGRPPEELLGTDYISVMTALRAAVEREGFWNGELRAHTRDGRKIDIDCRTTLVRDKAGRPRARLTLFADITEKKLLEEKFLHAQRLESIGMLAAGIAHDLNNVLAPIVFGAPILRDSLSSARDLKILDTLTRSAERGAALVNQILGFVRNTTSEFQSTQVKYLVHDIISLIEETFPKSIQLEHQIPSDLWPVTGNATQIHQVLLNLCVNARDAMPQGGTLRITATNLRLVAAAAGAIPGARSGAWLVLEIADTGTGIPPEVLEHIWEPFFTTKGSGKGTGLGLGTVRGIVSSHHGFIELRTKVGRGSAFRVFLPAAADESPAPTSLSPVHVPDGHGELILVVDDDVPLRDLVSDTLEKHGYRVIGCGNGVDAIALFDVRPGDIPLVITDVEMPRLGGLALARALLQRQPDIRLLAMSGLSSSEAGSSDSPEIQKLAHAFLLKPFTPEDLLAAMYRLLHPPEKP